MLTAERLREVLDYDAATGVFRWRVTYRRVKAGDVAGYERNPDGYRFIIVDGRAYGAHQLAWLHVYGEWRRLDHKDLDGFNNALDNLRPATRSQNGANVRISARNRSGFKGVHLRTDGTRKNPWRASIRVNRKLKHLGQFATAEEAHAAYMAAAQSEFGEFARAA